MPTDDSAHDLASTETLSLGDSVQEPEIGEEQTLPAEDMSPQSGSAPAAGAGRGNPAANYDILGEIAKGGMGRVLRAHDRRLQRRVALKEMLRPEGRAGRRFRREAMITARLQHPAIVPVYEAGYWPDGKPYYAMKLVEGTPLDQLIAAASSHSERMALLPKMLAVAEALAYAHSRGVIHRDLKPANIIVGAYGETVVIDWGLAKSLDSPSDPDRAPSERGPAPAPGAHGRFASGFSGEIEDDDREGRAARGYSALTAAGAVMGTPVYMPPEQARGQPADRRSDVYSLGAILYHLLSGQLPRTAENLEQILKRALSVRPRPIAELSPDLPADLCAIVDTAMADAPDDRYPSAEQLTEELRRFQTGQFVSAHDYSTRELVFRWLRRHRAAVSVAAVLTALMLVVAAVAFVRVVDERDAAERARDNARTARTAAESLVDYMLVDLNERLAPTAQLELLQGIAEKVQDYLERMGTDGDDDSLERQRRQLLLVGDVLLPQASIEEAEAAYRQALKVSRLLARRHPNDRKRARMVASAQRSLGRALAQAADDAGAERAYDESVAALKALADAHPDDPAIHEELAESLMHLGDLHFVPNGHRSETALALFREVRDLAARWAEKQPDEQVWLRLRTTSEARLGAAAE